MTGGKTSPLCSCEQVSQKLLRCRIGLPIHRRRKGRCRGGSVDQQRRQQQLRRPLPENEIGPSCPGREDPRILFYFFLMLKHQTSTINRITTCRSSKVSNLRKYLRGETKSWSSKNPFLWHSIASKWESRIVRPRKTTWEQQNPEQGSKLSGFPNLVWLKAEIFKNELCCWIFGNFPGRGSKSRWERYNSAAGYRR